MIEVMDGVQLSAEELIEMHYLEFREELCKKFKRRAGTFENAEDVVQEAYARALRFKDSYDGTRPFYKWFNTIINNALKDFKRAERVDGMVIEFDEELDEGVTFSEEEHDYMKRIVAEMNAKRGETAKALKLYFLKGYPPRDIYQTLDMSKKAVYQAIFRFQRDMREKFDGS